MAVRRKTQNISLQPIEWLALRWLSREDRDGRVSPTAARLIDNEMRSRFGPQWREELERIIEGDEQENERSEAA